MILETDLQAAITAQLPTEIRLPAECPYCAAWRTLADDAARGMAAAGQDVDALLAEIGELRAMIEKREIWLTEESAANQAWREQLDQAHQHVGALLARIEQARQAEDAFMRDSTRQNARDEEDAQVTLIRAENAARAWLRREAK